MADDEAELTLAAYERHADQYIERSRKVSSGPVVELVARVPVGARVLEVGSGPGWDADALEAAGLVVDRTDGALAFVDRMRAAGHPARVLDVLNGDFGGPYDAVYANAVLLHVPRARFVDVLASIAAATRPGGLLVATLKKADGEGWSDRKLDDPRYFIYWQEPALLDALSAACWIPESVRETTGPGAAERWITAIARSGTARSTNLSTPARRQS